MHEAALVASLVENLLAVKDREGARRIIRFQVAVGELSGVDLEAFHFAYEALRDQTKELKEAHMEVLKIPARFLCERCGQEFSGDYFSACPHCKSYLKTVLYGEELELREIELEV